MNQPMQILLPPKSDQFGDWNTYYNTVAASWDQLKSVRKGYYAQIQKYLNYCIPKGSRVLEIGCSTGDLLNALEPSYGVGIDFSALMIELAKSKYPHLTFVHASLEEFQTTEEFDYIILDSVVSSLADVEYAFHCLARLCKPHTRLILNYHNSLWEFLYGIASAVGLRRKQPNLNWISTKQMENFLYLAGFEIVRTDPRHFFPFQIPGIETVLERFVGRFPLIQNASLMFWSVARFCGEPRKQNPAVSVICPCRNEAGNIRHAVERLPEMGGGTELIFVEGNSTDNTFEECQKVVAEFGGSKNLKLIRQGDGKGKGDAVRKGFAVATGDILMILDADLTVPPEDLPKFYHAIASERGEFINGTRLVYPMEKQAMRFLNKLGNKFFSYTFTWILGQQLTDTLCGTKVIWRKDYERLAANRHYFGEFDPFGDYDLIFGAAKLGLDIVEVPVRYRERVYGSTNISRFRHGLLLLRMSLLAALKIRFY